MSATSDVLSSTAPTKQFLPYAVAKSRSCTIFVETSDAALIEGIAAGDRTAMHALYERHSDEVFRFALRLVGDRTLADAVVSETFTDLWHKAWAFDDHYRVSTYLLGITLKQALVVRRRECDFGRKESEPSAVSEHRGANTAQR